MYLLKCEIYSVFWKKMMANVTRIVIFVSPSTVVQDSRSSYRDNNTVLQREYNAVPFSILLR